MLFHFLFIAFFLGVGNTCPTDLQVETCLCEEHDGFFKKSLYILCYRTDVDQLVTVLKNAAETNISIELVLRDISLESLTSHLLVGMRLQKFSAVQCNVSAVDENAFSSGIDTLTAISLTFNNLERVPTSSLNKLRDLWGLFLDFNRIEVLHADSIKGMHSLRVLSLTGNRLKYIHDSAFEMGSEFFKIYLDRNELTSVPSRALSKLSVIIELHLDNNEIASLQLEEFSFTGGPSVEKLWLTRNRIRHIPPSAFSWMKSLTYLQLHRNRIESVDPLSFEGIGDTLDHLSLSENLLNEVPAASLRKMRRLTRLDLEGNHICKIREDDFVPYGTTLKALRLFSNSLTFMDPKSLVSLNSLEGLGLRDNKLNMLPYETYAPVLDTLKTFDVSGNPLHCDCDVAWLRDLDIWTSLPSCASPKEHARVDLGTIPKDSLVCRNSTLKPPLPACDSGPAEKNFASSSPCVTSNVCLVTLQIGLTYFICTLSTLFWRSKAGTAACPPRWNRIFKEVHRLTISYQNKMCLTGQPNRNYVF